MEGDMHKSMQRKDDSWKQWQTWFTFRPWQRHSLVLMVGGIVYVSMGISLIYRDAPTDPDGALLGMLIFMAPINVWGIVFTVAGIMAILSSRWPPFADSWGYVVLGGLSWGLAASYISSYFLIDAPIESLNQGFRWSVIAFLWWAISGLVNPGSLDKR